MRAIFDVGDGSAVLWRGGHEIMVKRQTYPAVELTGAGCDGERRKGRAKWPGADVHSARRSSPHSFLRVRSTGHTEEWQWWFSDDKGFGFITPDEPGKDLCVHHSGIVGEGYHSLAEGARVSYDAEAGDKGPKAINVTRI